MKKKGVYLFLGFIIFVFLGSFIRKELNNGYAPRLFLESDLHDFGSVMVGDTVEFYVQLTNSGNRNLKVSNIHPDCGCTVVNWEEMDLIEPQKVDSFLVTYNTEEPGAFVRQIAIESNSKDGTAVFYVQGTVSN